jgi:hypothetical protein
MSRVALLFAIIFIISCKGKQADLSSDAPIKPNQFVKAFEVLENGFAANDSNIVRLSDTVSINIKLLARFIPDTLIKRLMNGDENTTFHPIGRVDKSTETYLLLLSIKNRKPTTTVVVLDKKNIFIASKKMFSGHDNTEEYRYTISINREPTFFVGREKIVNDKDLKFTKIGWAFNGKDFIQVVKESNERSDKLSPIINPLDTFARENSYSGNYVQDDRNYIAIRDGKTKQDYLFFLHIDKNDGNCVGELKGEMHLIDSTHATYSMGGDPCVIDITFDRNIIVTKEKGSCGNRRGMECFFDDAYTKKKEPKKKIVKPIVVKIPTANVTKMLLPTAIKKDKKTTTPKVKKVITPKIIAPKATTKPDENPYIN